MNKETEAQSSQKHIIKLGSQNVQRAISHASLRRLKVIFLTGLQKQLIRFILK